MSKFLEDLDRGVGTGEASEARASPEFRGFSTEKFLTSWIYEGGNFSCFTGKKLVPRPLVLNKTIRNSYICQNLLRPSVGFLTML